MPARPTKVAKELRTIRASLQQLERALGRLGTAVQGSAISNGTAGRKIVLTPARQAALRLQGQYLGHMRGLGPRQKAKVKKIRATKGIRAAIAAARRLGS